MVYNQMNTYHWTANKVLPECSKCKKIEYSETCWNEGVCEQCDKLLKEVVM